MARPQQWPEVVRARARGLGKWSAAWCCMAAVALVAAPASAGDTLQWDEPSGGNAWIADNWDPVDVPDPDDDLVFDLSASYKVFFNATVARSNTMSFRDGVVSVDFQSPHRTGPLYVGKYSGDVADMSIMNGSLRATYWDVGYNGSTGTMLVTGPDAVCSQEPNSFNDLRLGVSGGTASVTFEDGGRGLVADDVYVGYSGAADATLTVTGTGYNGSEYQRSSLTSDSLFGSRSLHVGFSAGSTGTVEISDGGLIGVDYAYVGHNDPNGTGEVTIGGYSHSQYATLEVGQTLRIGDAGTGTVTLSNYGNATVGGTTYVGAASGSRGTLDLSGGELTTVDLAIAETGELVVSGGGYLRVEGGSFTTAGSPSLDVSGTIRLSDGATGDVYAGGFNLGTDVASYLNVVGGSELTTGPATISNGRFCQASLSGEDGAGAGSRWHVTGDLDVAREGQGNLYIYEGGSTVADGSMYVGRMDGSQGIVVLEGSSSNGTTCRLEVGGSLRIGGYYSSGYGDVLVAGGSVVEVGDAMSVGHGGGETRLATGELRITGFDEGSGSRSSMTAPAGSLLCGYYGSSEVKVDDGGLLDVGVSILLGDSGAPDPAVMTVTGVHASGQRSEAAAGAILTVAYLSDAELHILEGAAMTGGSLVVAYYSGRTGAVEVLAESSGLRSTFHVSGAADIGYYGTGSVVVRDGALLEIDNAGEGDDTVLAYGEEADGSVTVAGTAADGTPTTWNNGGDLTIGRRGSGLVGVSGGAQVRAGTTCIASEPSDATSRLTVSDFGSRFEADNAYVGGCATAPGGTGQVELSGDAAMTVAGALKVWGDGSMVVDGATLTVGDLAGDNNPGALAFNSGTLTVGGDLVLGAAGPLYPILTLDASRDMTVGRIMTVAPGASVAVAGGSLAAGSIVNAGTFAFVSGDLALTSSDLPISPGGLLGDDVLIDATRSLSVSGTTSVNADATLTVDGGHFSTRTLLVGGSVYLHSHDVDVDAGSTIYATGRVFVGNAQSVDVAGAVTNMGRIELMGGGARLGGGSTLGNSGLIVGDGEIAKAVTNHSGGEIRAEAGARLLFSEVNGVNAGQISLQGGAAEFAQPLTNGSTGVIAGRGTLIARGGLTNFGDVTLSSGTTDVVGDANNTGSGRVIVSGRADVTFWDDVHNGGALFRVSAGSSATFFGAYSGNGISGDGEKYFEGTVLPGASPAAIEFGGNVTFGPMADLEIELADPDNSNPLAPRFDALDVANDVTLAGTLSLSWLPVAGDPSSKFGGVYSVITYGGARTGTFDAVDCQMAAYLDTSVFADGIEYDDTNGEIKVHLHDLLDGDADLNGAVNREDFLAMQAGAAAVAPDWFDGDFDFNGAVSFADYLAWKANVGTSVPGAGVPEPATLALLALGGLVVTRRRRQQA